MLSRFAHIDKILPEETTSVVVSFFSLLVKFYFFFIHFFLLKIEGDNKAIDVNQTSVSLFLNDTPAKILSRMCGNIT